MAVFLSSPGVLVLSDSERRHLIAALDAAVASPGSRTTRATIDHWRVLREVLR